LAVHGGAGRVERGLDQRARLHRLLAGAHVLVHDVARAVGRDVARRGAAHAVEDRVQPPLGVDDQRVLVVIADLADVALPVRLDREPAAARLHDSSSLIWATRPASSSAIISTTMRAVDHDTRARLDTSSAVRGPAGSSFDATCAVTSPIAITACRRFSGPRPSAARTAR